MRSHTRAVLLAGGALALAVSLGAAPALATGTTWTIEPGGFYRAGPVTSFLTDTATGTKLTCAFSTFDVKVRSGSGTSHLGNVRISSFPICYLPDGLGFDGFWHASIHGSSYTASTGVTRGKFENITLGLAGSGCSVTGGGFVRFTYSNSDATLKISTSGSGLSIGGTGCQGLLNVGTNDPATFSFKSVVTPAQTITSP
jgi:hypothetical protein